jgi:hypothetical protein
MTDRPNWRVLARGRRRAAAPAQSSIAEPPRLGKRLWTALNSPFALLLISSVVLAGISQHFARTQAEASERAERRASFFKLFSELEYRMTRLQMDEDGLSTLDPDDAATMRRLGMHARAVITGMASDGQSAPEYQKMYLGAIVNQVELTAGLPANRELEPVFDELAIDDCETAVALHGELNVLRKWITLREPLVDAGKLPKLPTEVLPRSDQASLVMPDQDALRGEDAARWRSTGTRLESLRAQCEDAPLPAQ